MVVTSCLTEAFLRAAGHPTRLVNSRHRNFLAEQRSWQSRCTIYSRSVMLIHLNGTHLQSLDGRCRACQTSITLIGSTMNPATLFTPTSVSIPPISRTSTKVLLSFQTICSSGSSQTEDVISEDIVDF